MKKLLWAPIKMHFFPDVSVSSVLESSFTACKLRFSARCFLDLRKKSLFLAAPLCVFLILSLITNVAFSLGKPYFIDGNISRIEYDGITNDLLTAGLGKSGLISGAPAPYIADPNNPTQEELRTLAIYSNYRALLDLTPGGGFGVIYGPNVLNDGTVTNGEGLIGGTEYIAYSRARKLNARAALMVQIPNHFDPENPCIVTAPASGSRGIYGAVGVAGDWGLKQGCAVAYTDKGLGMGVHDLMDDTVHLIRGEREGRMEAGHLSHFSVDMSDSILAEYNKNFPGRFAWKHAHSKANPEKRWGHYVLASVKFAFWAINNELKLQGYSGEKVRPEKTIVIGSSLSNGGAASIKAAELRWAKKLIDGIAVIEPNVTPVKKRFTIRVGSRPALCAHSKPLADYATLKNLYQPCALLASSLEDAPFDFVPASLRENRCISLKEKNLLTSTTLQEQAEEALQILNNAGINSDQNILMASHATLQIANSIVATYLNSYGRFGPEENLCGVSFAATSGNNIIPDPENPEYGLVEFAFASQLSLSFGQASGIPATSGFDLVNNNSLGGARESRVSISESTGRQDQNIDAAICFRNLVLGYDIVTGKRLNKKEFIQHQRIIKGINAIKARGRLGGIPVIFAAGRNDAVLSINDTSRSYYALTQKHREKNVRYYEVLNAHHLDSLNGISGMDTLMVPLHYYLISALNIMYDHLTIDAPLPPSQVVRTTARSRDATGAVLPISVAENLPPIANDPGDNAILFSRNVLLIPE